MERDLDSLMERRLLRRRVLYWRLAAVFLLLILFASRSFYSSSPQTGFSHIAKIEIDGMIKEDPQILKMIENISKDENVKGVLLSINSGGGTVGGSDQLYKALFDLGEKKPIVASIGGVAASGAYLVALSAEKIYCLAGSIIGSIGVIFMQPNVSKALDKIGIKVNEVKTSPLKAAPGIFEKETDPEAIRVIQEVMTDTHNWFKQVVQERRKLSKEELKGVSDGRIFSGKKGKELKLVDEIGYERDAILWLETEKQVEKGLPVELWEPEEESWWHVKLKKFASSALLQWGAKFFSFVQETDSHFQGQILAIWKGN